ncbi:MAG: DUF503 domain-containing protein [Planctomycetes bacterium]|nr:DUF503 domain-containing protein [Planctomycetota bacterium]MCB9892383.1 DUF503 domain-containing protein [Planctomycetota bacterium]MCB9918532.1 DUF503 domain-containing protein [Planctomycetota bacterium]
MLQAELEVPWARSLKDKRSVVKSIRDKTRRHFNVSIAEVENQDTITSIVIGVVMAGTDVQYILGALEKFKESLRDWPEARLLDTQVEVL